MESGDLDEDIGLRSARRKAFELFEAGQTPQDHQRLQAYLVDSILSAEALRSKFQANREKRFALRDHIRQLRAFGDALAWRVLHPHTIRQLGKNQAMPPLLSDQRAAVELAKECVEGIAKEGHTALISDLTNILRIGDLIVAGHPEYPLIMELKASKVPESRKYLGRRGRQMSRMEGTGKYLFEGEAQVYGEPYVRRVVELDVKGEYNDRAVAPLLEEALRTGYAKSKLAEHHFAVAFTPEKEFKVPDEFAESFLLDPRTLLGLHSRPLLEAWSEFRSPMVWDLAPELRWALMEQDVSLIHLLSFKALIGFRNADGEIVSIDDATPEAEEHGIMGSISVKIGDSLELMTLNTVHHVIYSNETVDSYCQWLIEGAKKSKLLIQSLEAEGRL
jgi:hypothetical protein